MAKGNLPRIDGVPVQVQQELEPVRKQEHAPIAEGYLPRRVDVKLPKYHARVLRDKLRQLQDDGARLRDGTIVSDRTKAMLWIIENLIDKSASTRNS
jgi:hypothetical protein